MYFGPVWSDETTESPFVPFEYNHLTTTNLNHQCHCCLSPSLSSNVAVSVAFIHSLVEIISTQLSSCCCIQMTVVVSTQLSTAFYANSFLSCWSITLLLLCGRCWYVSSDPSIRSTVRLYLTIQIVCLELS